MLHISAAVVEWCTFFACPPPTLKSSLIYNRYLLDTFHSASGLVVSPLLIYFLLAPSWDGQPFAMPDHVGGQHVEKGVMQRLAPLSILRYSGISLAKPNLYSTATVHIVITSLEAFLLVCFLLILFLCQLLIRGSDRGHVMSDSHVVNT